MEVFFYIMGTLLMLLSLFFLIILIKHFMNGDYEPQIKKTKISWLISFFVKNKVFWLISLIIVFSISSIMCFIFPFQTIK
ncbi:MAG: hypothetical protein ACRC9U_00585 [Metamycoplasmataceae bacterium]